jgi:hypothetical protein
MNKRRMLSLISLLSISTIFVSVLAYSQELAKEPQKITISSYEISIQKFDKPITRIDEKGNKARYEKAYIVELEGNIDVSGAIPIDIFIGDYRVPEYGGTKKGIYFKIYDEKLIKDLEDKPFGYGFENRKLKIFDLKFKPSTKKPFKQFKGLSSTPD